jgi:hypothetical protein
MEKCADYSCITQHATCNRRILTEHACQCNTHQCHRAAHRQASNMSLFFNFVRKTLAQLHATFILRVLQMRYLEISRIDAQIYLLGMSLMFDTVSKKKKKAAGVIFCSNIFVNNWVLRKKNTHIRNHFNFRLQITCVTTGVCTTCCDTKKRRIF